ncbi:cytochrome C [Cereibacter changlensis JA139]|uniref:Cytochrome C n=3 Tax=Cereibacter changlensis TaxID=402884 RepID=A0A2T4JNH9_9RHOB|nr:diheme cytochrome c [Cereibacter changlensis]PTE19413.1 cytochrome C [Cereibacter changlensis JA139]PZX47545.1 diheme cytochrome c [Cereibacter changlensis]
MRIRTLALAALLLPLTAFSLAADEDGEEAEREGGRAAMVVTHAATKAECSACHIAYPAGFLPVRSWRAIMTTLEDHFGEDASLDETTRADIEAYLVANAPDASGGRPLRGVDPSATPLRITELAWFTREHSREVSQSMKDKAKSMSNCAACHSGAERGVFEDD